MTYAGHSLTIECHLTYGILTLSRQLLHLAAARSRFGCVRPLVEADRYIWPLDVVR